LRTERVTLRHYDRRQVHAESGTKMPPGGMNLPGTLKKHRERVSQ